MSQPDVNKGNSRRRKIFPLSWGRVEKTSVVIGALGALIGIVVAVSNFVSQQAAPRPPSRLQIEQNMVGELVAGESYARLSALVGTPADFDVKLPSGNSLYQYERQWETIQMVVNPEGKVLSVGVYAKSASFYPHVGIPGAQIVLDRTLISKSLPDFQPDRVNAYCGAHQAGYFEAYDNLPMAYDLRGLVVGVSNSETTNINVLPICDMGGACGELSPSGDNLSAAYARCLLALPIAGKIRNGLPVSAVIVTAPDQPITTDMLYTPYDILTGN